MEPIFKYSSTLQIHYSSYTKALHSIVRFELDYLEHHLTHYELLPVRTVSSAIDTIKQGLIGRRIAHRSRHCQSDVATGGHVTTLNRALFAVLIWPRVAAFAVDCAVLPAGLLWPHLCWIVSGPRHWSMVAAFGTHFRVLERTANYLKQLRP